MDTIEQTLAIEEIKRLKARYFRAIDTHDWALLGETFTQDILCDFRGATIATGADSGQPLVEEEHEVLRGRDTALAGLEASLTGVSSVHQGFMPEIEIIDENSATGLWAMSDILLPDDAKPFRELRGYGHYHETYRKEGGAWRIASFRLTRLRVEIDR